MENLLLFEKNDFITELSEENTPGHLDQIEMFYEDTDQLFKSISEVIPASQLAVTYATVRNVVSPSTSDVEPKGYLLHWPDHKNGLSCVIRSDGQGQQNSLQAVFPFCSEGVEYLCRLDEIRLFHNRLEAQLKVMAGADEELALTFFDAHYLADRFVYRQGRSYRFIVRAFAYCLEVAGNSGEDTGWALFNRPDLGADHYEVQGPVESVAELEQPVLGQKTSKIRIIIGRTSEDEDCYLDIFVTQKVLGSARLPKPGDNIQSVIWLQGHLWGEESASDSATNT
jgi:hypothetical protein